MLRKYAWTIYLTWLIASTFSAVAVRSDWRWWQIVLCGSVSCGLCIYIWWRKIRCDNKGPIE